MRAGVAAAMAGINHHDAVGAERERRLQQQRLQIFLQIQTVDEYLAVNDLRGKAEIISMPRQVASRLPISRVIVPCGE